MSSLQKEFLDPVPKSEWVCVCVCVRTLASSHQQQFLDVSSMSKIQLSYDAIYPDRVRFHRKVLNLTRPSSASRTSCKSRLLPVFLTNWLQISFPWPTSWVQLTCYSGSQNSGKLVYSLDYQFITRMSITDRWDTECQAQGKAWNSVLTTQKLCWFLWKLPSQTPSVQPLAQPRSLEVEVFNPLITGFILLPAKWHLTSLSTKWGHTEVAVL